MNILNPKILLPKHIDYIIINQDLIIVDYSPKVVYFFDFQEDLNRGNDIREGIPELIGTEETINEILEGIKNDFDLKAITRIKEDSQIIYFDLYINFYQNDGDNPYLILFLEDVTDKMTLEQVLVQNTNETNLLLNKLNRSKDYINKIVSSMADGLIVTNSQGIIKTFNSFTLELFGYEEDELTDQKINLILGIEESRVNQLYELILQEGKSIKNFEITCETKQKKKIIVSFSCSIISSEYAEDQNDFNHHNIIYIGRDITQRKHHQKRLNIQYAIAKLLSDLYPIQNMMPNMLQEICEGLEWDVGELWLPQNKIDSFALYQSEKNLEINLQIFPLKRTEIWVNPLQNLTEFIEITGKILLPIGKGLAGKIWQENQSLWIDNLIDNDQFGQECLGVKVGLKTAFGFPIKSGDEVLGIMTFFSSVYHSLDEELTQILSATGSQLGQFIKRKQAEAALKQEQQETERLLLNILPKEIAEKLKGETQTIADTFDNVTVLFADLVGFTQLASELSAIEIVEILNIIFSQFDYLIEQHDLEKIKTIGDAYMIVGGLPIPNPFHETAMINMALDMLKSIAEFNRKTQNNLSLRIGIHTGSVVAGVIGTKKFIYDLWGDTVNIASRMESQGIAGKIQVTEDIYQRLKDSYLFEKRGAINIKGKGEMLTYFLLGKKN
jgi:adenylate cyclase